MDGLLREAWLSVKTADGPMRVFVVRPDSAQAFPGLVVIQEAFGVNDHIQDVCRRYAREGGTPPQLSTTTSTVAGTAWSADARWSGRPVT